MVKNNGVWEGVEMLEEGVGGRTGRIHVMGRCVGVRVEMRAVVVEEKTG